METTPKQVCDDLMALISYVKTTMFHIAEDHRLTPVQLFALYAISHETITMGAVADTLHCDASNVTGIVDRLVAQGLVVRTESKADRRTKTLQLTEEGSRTIRSIMNSLPNRLGCQRLSPKDLHAFHAAVTKWAGTV